MNKFGALAQTYWQADRAAEYALIEDPTAYFTALGQEISTEVARRRDAVERQAHAGQTTSFLTNLQGLNRSHASIEIDVMNEMVYQTHTSE